MHGIDEQGKVVIRRQLRRGQVLKYFAKLPPCLIGMEACATAHHWSRELRKLGHEVRLMPARYVKAYVKRNKNDAADAEAICEAVTRPTMRFVPVKDGRNSSRCRCCTEARQLFVRSAHRIRLINAIRAHLAEFGIVAGVGRNGMSISVAGTDRGEQRTSVFPDLEARECLAALAPRSSSWSLGRFWRQIGASSPGTGIQRACRSETRGDPWCRAR